VIALSIAAMVGIVIIGGIKRIAQVAQAVVPSMAVLYVAGCIAIIIANISAVPAAITLMFESAFNLQAAGGGMLGALIVGFQRATFSNEAGVGTAPIAHAAAKTSHPVRQGCVALLEPFIDTVIICFMTGIMITVTGVYLEGTGKTGVTLASASFATVIDWFPYVLSVCVTLFAYSTIITSGYYGEKAWAYLFGRKHIRLFQLLFCTGTFLGGVFQFGMVLTFSDLVMIAMAIPNVIGLYLMHNMISAEVSNYRKMLK
jgi:AGCS family alanine or glycine:cation symporter